MGDPDRTLTERVVQDPATRATAYGDAAVQQGVRVAQGGKKPAAKKKAPAPSAQPPHVERARRLWKALFGKDPVLAGVHIGDLKQHSDRHRAQRPGVGKLHATGYQAWTNSRREVYVSAALVTFGGRAMPDWYPEALLRHEAIHVRQFTTAQDAVPTYLKMIEAEASAYGDTVTFLKGVTPATADREDHAVILEAFEGIVTDFTTRSAVAATGLEHKKWMVTKGFLPEHTPSSEPDPRPLSLYVRTTP